MGSITILNETTKNPITLIGERAGVCWGSNTENPTQNYNRGLNCIKSGHNRLLEFVNVELVLDGYSARVIREWYTHIGGLPTRLQESTRYINYENFNFVVPKKISDNRMALGIYEATMDKIRTAYYILTQGLGIPKEDSAMLFPLGMSTKIVDKRNLRNLIEMSHQRMCSRAYWEYRELMNDIVKALSEYSDEWKYIVDNYFIPKCEVVGYCTESNCCGRKNKKEN